MWIFKYNRQIDKPRIDILPIMGVVLLLLLIFIMFTYYKPTISHKFEVRPIRNYPYDLAKVSKYNPTILLVIIDKNRNIYVNNKQVDIDLLDKEIAINLDRLPSDKRVIYIKATKKLQYGYLISIIDIIKHNRSPFIALQTEYLDE